MAARGMDTGNPAARSDMVTRVGRALRHQRSQGGVRAVRRAGKPVLWDLDG